MDKRRNRPKKYADKVLLCVDVEFLQAIKDLRTLHPGKKKSSLIREAVLEKVQRDSR